MEIKNITRNIYHIDYSNILLNNNDEFITESNGINDFSQYLRKNDPDNGVLVSFNNYKNGLFFSIKNGGQIYSDPSLLPELVTFSMDIIGLKKGTWYRVIVSARNAGSNSVITSNRDLVVTNSNNEAVINKNLSNTVANENFVGYFMATSEEEYLFFSIGKIVIKDIKIDEIELNSTEKQVKTKRSLGEGSKNIVAYGIFKMNYQENKKYVGRYIKLTRMGGYGIELYFDTKNISYVLERSNTENMMNESFNLPKYSIEINDKKLISFNIYQNIRTKDINAGISPNTMKQGYLEFCLTDINGKCVKYNNIGNIYIYIYENK